MDFEPKFISAVGLIFSCGYFCVGDTVPLFSIVGSRTEVNINVLSFPFLVWIITYSGKLLVILKGILAKVPLTIILVADPS